MQLIIFDFDGTLGDTRRNIVTTMQMTKTCGVTYGNGTRRELEEAGAEYIIDTIDKLIDIVR